MITLAQIILSSFMTDITTHRQLQNPHKDSTFTAWKKLLSKVVSFLYVVRLEGNERLLAIVASHREFPYFECLNCVLTALLRVKFQHPEPNLFMREQCPG